MSGQPEHTPELPLSDWMKDLPPDCEVGAVRTISDTIRHSRASA